MKKMKIKEEYSGYKVSEYLKKVEFYSSRSFRKIDIYINSKKAEIKNKLEKNDILEIEEHKKGTNIKPIKMKLDIIYENEDVLLINKPSNLITHPTAKKVDKTLANGIVNYYLEEYGEIRFPRFYNRLDMNTTGIIVATKTSFGQSFLQKYGELEKYYLAIVKGIIEEDDLEINKNIYRPTEAIKREVSETEGQNAKTKVKVLKRNYNENITLVKLQLFTGRTHQIRVHMNSIGHPVLGDELYGGKDFRVKRQLLHSYKIVFRDPVLKEMIEKTIDLPEDMKNLLNI
ncbi:MAG: RNA pseudouridine synthase [Fusobacteriia bacterium 4572_132]|nr:MAG: RNA pseudouridine synthase [Fusobacteriia bacterium 4572_132]